MAEELTVVVMKRREEEVEGAERKKDMLAALLAADERFSDEEIVDFLVAILVAGYETTSTIMTLAVKFVTETPLALAQLKVFFSMFVYMCLCFSDNTKNKLVAKFKLRIELLMIFFFDDIFFLVKLLMIYVTIYIWTGLNPFWLSI